MKNYVFTSESVGEGHPDKICDQISDVILDAYLKKDKESKVAIECFVKGDLFLIGGEITSKADVNIEEIVREKIKELGYDNEKYGFNFKTCKIILNITRQSPDIAQGVAPKKDKEQGAGDQGIMFGYATNETKEYMPLSIILSHKLMRKLSELRRNNEIEFIGSDAKSQVSVEYADGKPSRIKAIVLSVHHNETKNLEELRKELIEKVIAPVCGNLIDKETKIYINPAGRFVIGGPAADAGLTGRKIIVDTYGGYARHGGGCFSGKDPSKVDRSAAYAARYIAKNIVASGIADKCEIQLSYAIGIAKPISIYVDCFGTNKISNNKIEQLIKKYFPIKPADIIKKLDLKKPIYSKTAVFGHFGREEFSWERLDKVEILKNEFEQRQSGSFI